MYVIFTLCSFIQSYSQFNYCFEFIDFLILVLQYLRVCLNFQLLQVSGDAQFFECICAPISSLSSLNVFILVGIFCQRWGGGLFFVLAPCLKQCFSFQCLCSVHIQSLPIIFYQLSTEITFKHVIFSFFSFLFLLTLFEIFCI